MAIGLGKLFGISLPKILMSLIDLKILKNFGEDGTYYFK